MKLTVISLVYSADAGFDAEPLEEFCATHAVAGWVDHFFVQAGKPELVVVLEYEDRTEGRRGDPSANRAGGEDQEDGGGALTGVFFYRLEAGKYSETKRMVLVK